MMNDKINPNAYREIYIILTKLNLYDRLPENLRIHIEAKQNKEHKFDFDENIPLFYQVENNETKNLLTYIFIKYINTNSADAQRIKDSMIDIMKKQIK